jgi:FlaA1/EpsC-like NDP-sugar epimerase
LPINQDHSPEGIADIGLRIPEFWIHGSQFATRIPQFYDMRPIEEQTILITGATSGLGRELAQALAKQGATILLHGRDPERCRETVREIKETTENQRIQFYCADLSSLAEVEELASKSSPASLGLMCS